MINAKTASIIATNSYNRKEKEKKENSVLFLEEKLDLNIKQQASNGNFILNIFLESNEIKKININFIITELKELGYSAEYDAHYRVLEIKW